jgi:hypothetical protein
MPVVSLDIWASLESPLFVNMTHYYIKFICFKFTKKNYMSHCSQIQGAHIQHLVDVMHHEDWRLSQSWARRMSTTIWVTSIQWKWSQSGNGKCSLQVKDSMCLLNFCRPHVVIFFLYAMTLIFDTGKRRTQLEDW